MDDDVAEVIKSLMMKLQSAVDVKKERLTQNQMVSPNRWSGRESTIWGLNRGRLCCMNREKVVFMDLTTCFDQAPQQGEFNAIFMPGAPGSCTRREWHGSLLLLEGNTN